MSNLALPIRPMVHDLAEPSVAEYRELLQLAGYCLEVSNSDDLDRVFERMHRLLPFESVMVANLVMNPARGFEVSGIFGQGEAAQPSEVCARPEDLNGSPLLENVLSELGRWASRLNYYVLNACGHPSVLFTYNSRLASCSHQQRVSLLCLSHPDVSELLRQRQVLEYLIPHLDAAMHRMAPASSGSALPVRLSNREKDVLAWVSRGKSSWEASCILGISENTVKFHLTNIYNKLNVRTRVEAVVKASELQLI